MRTYERNGVLVDQCEECRGIFLDRGELERLLEAGTGEGRDSRSERHPDHGAVHDRDEDEGHGSRRRSGPTSFLSDLLGGD